MYTHTHTHTCTHAHTHTLRQDSFLKETLTVKTCKPQYGVRVFECESESSLEFLSESESSLEFLSASANRVSSF